MGFILTGRFEILLANEILRPPAETYASNFKVKILATTSYSTSDLPAIILGDVEEVDFKPLEGEEVDVVVGGPPCQDFSVLRGPGRRGIEVRRGRLYMHFIRALVQLQPKVFVFENVPGLVSANSGLAYRVIIEDLRNPRVNGKRSEGYEIVFSDVVDMVKLGLPQIRKRLIIIGFRKDLVRKLGVGTLRSVVAKARKLTGGGSVFAKYPLVPIEVFEGDVLTNLQDVYGDVMKAYEDVWEEVNTPRAWEWKREVWDRLTFDIVEDYRMLNRIEGTRKELDEAMEAHGEVLKEMGYLGRKVEQLSPPDGSNVAPQESPQVVERLRCIPPGENYKFVVGTRWEVKSFVSICYRRIHPLVPSYTIVAYGGGGTWGYHYRRDKTCLTNRERARLQSFPDVFLFRGTRVRAQIGEAVPPVVAKRVAEVVASMLEELK